jgi:FMN phosphatase YigB (HAD superfamily)
VDNAIHYHPFTLELRMTLTLLIDLDDTLLGNKMDTFIPAYLGALGNHIATYTPPALMVKTMLAATQQMFANTSTNRTLKAAFDPHFYPPQGLTENLVKKPFQQFYAEKFPDLEPLTQFRPAAVEFIEAAIGRGYQIGIATNPLFPLTAIQQRLDWAGLSSKKYPFSLVPSYESFHFAKPNPAYFAEFLGRIGWPKGPIIMIGNDLDHDVQGATDMGIPVFWVSEGNDQNPADFPAPTASGRLEDILPWLDKTPLSELQPNFADPSALLAILRGSPAAFHSMLGEIPDDKWPQRPQPDEWSLTEILVHLRDVEREVNLPRFKKILTEESPFISGVDTDLWAGERAYINQDGPAAFEAFLAARTETLDLLDQLKPDDWHRPFRHAIFGPTELKELARITTDHERLHGRQIHSVLSNKEY